MHSRVQRERGVQVADVRVRAVLQAGPLEGEVPVLHPADGLGDGLFLRHRAGSVRAEEDDHALQRVVGLGLRAGVLLRAAGVQSGGPALPVGLHGNDLAGAGAAFERAAGEPGAELLVHLLHRLDLPGGLPGQLPDHQVRKLGVPAPGHLLGLHPPAAPGGGPLARIPLLPSEERQARPASGRRHPDWPDQPPEPRAAPKGAS